MKRGTSLTLVLVVLLCCAAAAAQGEVTALDVFGETYVVSRDGAYVWEASNGVQPDRGPGAKLGEFLIVPQSEMDIAQMRIGVVAPEGEEPRLDWTENGLLPVPDTAVERRGYWPDVSAHLTEKWTLVFEYGNPERYASLGCWFSQAGGPTAVYLAVEVGDADGDWLPVGARYTALDEMKTCALDADRPFRIWARRIDGADGMGQFALQLQR